MASNFEQPGKVIQYTNGTGSGIAAGSVVKMGNILGVALVAIAAGATGSVQIDGVFTVPKVSGAVIAQGESLTWDVSVGAFDDNLAVAASGDVTGAAAVAFEGAGNGVATLAVKFTGVPGTVAA
jgi:predicted RecA/RadA family phage recombinase